MESELPKQYIQLDNGLSVLDQTLKTLLEMEKIQGLVIAISANDAHFKHSEFYHHPKLLAVATGGKQRFNSVMNAMEVLKEHATADDWVLVHDAARPCVDPEDINHMIEQLQDHAVGGLLATPVVDTIKYAHQGVVQSTVDRQNLWQAQTPQMYRFGVLSEALTCAINQGVEITDEAGSIENMGLKSKIIPGSKTNIKITTQEDLALANFYLSNT